jgi:hypothetical protein
LTAGITLLFRLYVQPSAAMSDILDRGSLAFASIAVLAVSLLLGHSSLGLSFPFYAPLLVLAAAYVPGLLAIGTVVGRIAGGFGGDFRRDYAPLLTCVASAWTAANIPLLGIAWFVPVPQVFITGAVVCYLYFVVLMFFAARTVLGAGNGSAVVIVLLSWLPLVAAYFIWNPIRYLLGWLASPFFLFYIFYYLRGEMGDLGAGWRNRQNFRRNLEAAAVNPHDGEVQYQLGLIYQNRRQTTEAIRRFEQAVAIDPTHTDAHF